MQQTQLDHALIQKRSGKFLRVALVASLALVSVVVSLVWLQILDSSSDDIDIKILIIKYGFACLVSALALFVGYTTFATTRRLAESEALANRLAGHDTLSGLPNRLLFSQNIDDVLNQATKRTSGSALFYIDLDRFKEINDTLGHDAGDAVIVAVASRIQSVMRKGDYSARFGGDEFSLFLSDIRSLRDCEMIAKRLLDAIRVPLTVRGVKVAVSASIGIAMRPSDAADRQTLMRLADLALYRAKKDGRNRFAFFEPSMDEDLNRRKAAEDELRLAIEGGEITVSYQPIFNSDGRTIVAVEALARWNHPTKGQISPDHFIKLAEERNLIVPLGDWVLRRACKDARAWPGLRIAVNVSPIQFRNRAFVETIQQAINDTGFDPYRLELEVTEGVVVDNIEQAEAAMSQLRSMGVRIALDDFGSGYSSLIYLRRFAFDKIKLDRMFLHSVTTNEDKVVLQSITQLGRGLGLTVTAEGIETTAQHELLQSLGCHEMQGFLFSRPVDAAEITRMIAGTHATTMARDEAPKLHIVSG